MATQVNQRSFDLICESLQKNLTLEEINWHLDISMF